ncbi:protocatechuate 3,4-dioxygenase subunit alpha [Sulfitobacter guttiformis]|uniref:Protocatechuate 3,4-dioxygenase alpha subunit n=1 Tax=Sulfitobacter guttiformis TaxID=74349 RepID=A0A420DIZ2_9RHOB|nr:protocatechuate 3,4-dioxygenase subunit alpha [Sulfitobacter guttiformis]KIN72043.1 Protocatechuate 3,4-dioxygenase, alpha subunit [Sulfitobacter guttiformis KCTC 32187]RKE94175.1 protocatechuate 3,4-dioxygenase alpha subunit [Sulfitobacter guttiformis]
MDDFPETASQTAGPYVHIGCTPNFAGINGVYPQDLGRHMIGEAAKGKRIILTGIIYDGDGTPMRDAMIEAWQPDAAGLFAGQKGADPAVSGFGRCPCDAIDGRFRFETVKPGSVAFPDGRMQAPHITLWIVARGINLGLHTRAYFAGDEALAHDPVLARIEHKSRVRTLLAQPKGDGVFEINIHLQGPEETIFFDA